MEYENKAIDAVNINGDNDDDEQFGNDDVQSPDPPAGDDKSRPHTGDGASPGKIFIGGLARDTTSTQFLDHFGKYGEITDSVIMKDRMTGAPRGFGFVTYADASVVDKVIEDTHIINGKQVEIKRTIPRGAGGSKDLFKTKKIFVGGIPTSVTEDEVKDFFTKFGEVKEHMIMRDHSTGRSRGFGFVTFEMEQAVDDLLSNGNRIDFAGVQVEIKKAEPKKPNPPPPAPSKRRGGGYGGNPKSSFGGGYGGASGGYGGATGGYGGGGFGAGSYRSAGAYGDRVGAYSGYGGYGDGNYGSYQREPASLGYSARYGGGGYGRGNEMGGGGGGGGYGGPGEIFGAYGGAGATGGYGGGYDGGYGGSSYGGGSGGGGGEFYGSRGGYGGGVGGGSGGGGRGRYHPYGR